MTQVYEAIHDFEVEVIAGQPETIKKGQLVASDAHLFHQYPEHFAPWTPPQAEPAKSGKRGK